MRRLTITMILILGMATLLTACGSSLLSRRTANETFRGDSHVVILPFDNFSGREKAGVKITDYFQSIMAGSGQYTVIGYGNTLDILRRLRVRSSSMITNTQIDSLSQALGANLIVTGTVLEFTEMDNNFLGKIPQVSFNTKVINCASHQTVWVGVSNGSGDESETVFGIGAIRSADRLASSMVTNVVAKINALFRSH